MNNVEDTAMMRKMKKSSTERETLKQDREGRGRKHAIQYEEMKKD